MTKFDQIKILDNKIKANKAQYMSDRKTLRYLQNQVVRVFNW